ncbi:hypothetical protein BH10PLA2_BH10PLA2_39340 [soil metagenome]
MNPDRLPGDELLQFLDVYDPALVSLALGLRELILSEAPEANEIVYDGAYTVAPHYSATVRYQDAFCYIALFSKHINLGFSRGAELPDPKKRLEGAGTQMRHIKLKDPADLEQPELRTFLRAALKNADFKKVIKASEEEMGQTIIKRFAGAKKRPGG